jgi:hypothetical protein
MVKTLWINISIENCHKFFYNWNNFTNCRNMMIVYQKKFHENFDKIISQFVKTPCKHKHKKMSWHDEKLCKFASNEISLWRKVVCLFCFVCHGDISQILMLLVMLLVPLESFQGIVVHQFSFIMCWPIYCKKYWRLNIIFIKKSFKPKQKLIGKFGCTLYNWKPLNEYNLM